MNISFSKEDIVKSAIGPYDHYCVGHYGKGSYLTALIMEIASFKKTFSHAGSMTLDEIIAYDRAEVFGTYIGQINMIIVSSFCGPQGVIWGYDIAKKEDISLSTLLPNLKKNIKEFRDIEIKNGKNLRKAARALFGTRKGPHFPFLPGTHVPCAGRFFTKLGPAILYGVIAIGIPTDRSQNACVLMEDVGEIVTSGDSLKHQKEKLLKNAIGSVIEIGKNQGIKYKEIFIDFISKKIASNEIGCVLVAMPYFLLAKKALTENLIHQDLKTWIENVKTNFLCNQYFG
jgi:histidine decarboxylase